MISCECVCVCVYTRDRVEKNLQSGIKFYHHNNINIYTHHLVFKKTVANIFMENRSKNNNIRYRNL